MTMKKARLICLIAVTAAMLNAAAGMASDKIFVINKSGVFTHIDIDSLPKSCLVVYIARTPNGAEVAMGQVLKINKMGKVKPTFSPFVIAPSGGTAPADGQTVDSIGVGNDGRNFDTFYTIGELGSDRNRVRRAVIKNRSTTVLGDTPIYDPNAPILHNIEDVFRPTRPLRNDSLPQLYRNPAATIYGETRDPGAVPQAGLFICDQNGRGSTLFPAFDSNQLGRSDAPRIFGGAYDTFRSNSNINTLWGDYFYIDVSNGFEQDYDVAGAPVHIEAGPNDTITIPTPNRTPRDITSLPPSGPNGSDAAVLFQNNAAPNQLLLERIRSSHAGGNYDLTRQQTDSLNANNLESPTLTGSYTFYGRYVQPQSPAANDNYLFFAVGYNRTLGRFQVFPFTSDAKFTGERFRSKRVGKDVLTLRAHVAGQRLLIVYTTGSAANQQLKLYAMDLTKKLG